MYCILIINCFNSRNKDGSKYFRKMRHNSKNSIMRLRYIRYETGINRDLSQMSI